MTISCAIIAPNYETNYYVVLFSFTLVIILAFFTTKWVAKTKFSSTKGQHLKVIERLYLTSDKMLIIVQIGESYLLMSQDKSSIRFIKELEGFEPTLATHPNLSFAEVFKKIKNGKEK